MQNRNTRQDNFVSPDPKPPRLEIVTHELPAPPISLPMPHSSHLDRGRAFVLVTAPLAAATGFVVLLIGIAAYGIPVLSVAALLISLAGFTVAWLIAYIAHTLISADGSLLIHVISMWAYLKREQAERHKRYGKQ